MYRGVPSSALASHWRREVLRTSLWFVPAIEVVAAIALFAGTLAADRAAYHGDFVLPGWVISGSADAARQILTTIAAAIITVVGVVFSIILVTLTLASTQFGPRMLRNFIRDRGTQVTLGTFVGTFVYSVLVLVSIGVGSHGDFVPHIGVTVTLGLMVADLAVLIYFIHHTAISIQLPQVIAGIAADLAEAIKEQGGGNAEPHPKAGPTAAELLSHAEAGGGTLLAPASGYVQFITYQHLVRLATEADAVISLEHRPGHFIVRGHRFASVWPPEAAPLIRQALGRAHVVGPYRTLSQDVSFGIDQLVEIALRALSAAVNDTFTALTCIDWLGENLCKIVAQWHPARVYRDARGFIRVVAAEPSYDRLVQRSFEKIRQSSLGQPAVMIRMLEALTRIMAETTSEGQRRVLLEQADMINRACERSVPEAARPRRHPAALRGHPHHGGEADRERAELLNVGRRHCRKRGRPVRGTDAGTPARRPGETGGNVKYVILLLDTEAARTMSEAEGQAWYAEIGAWYEKGGGGSGKLVEGGHQLAPPATAKTVRAGGVTDGPFMETKEALGGYSVLETDTIEEAVEIAKTWPGVDRGWITVEVRPVVEM